MSSMMEFTAEKTPLTKNTDRKKGMTLVEVMAAMASSFQRAFFSLRGPFTFSHNNTVR